jgi:hypothetical protein
VRVLTVRWPAFVMGGITLLWMLTGGHAYFFSEGISIVSQFGQLGSNVNSNMADIGRLSDAQQFVADMGRFVVVAVAVLAVIGFLRRSAAGHWELEAAVLCAVPAAILAGGSYGGEAVFRVFLFALPFATYLAAGALYATAKRATWRSATVVFLLSAMLITGFGFGYYGKEQWFAADRRHPDVPQRVRAPGELHVRQHRRRADGVARVGARGPGERALHVDGRPAVLAGVPDLHPFAA